MKYYEREDKVVDFIIVVLLEELTDGFAGAIANHCLIMCAKRLKIR